MTSMLMPRAQPAAEFCQLKLRFGTNWRDRRRKNVLKYFLDYRNTHSMFDLERPENYTCHKIGLLEIVLKLRPNHFHLEKLTLPKAWVRELVRSILKKLCSTTP